MEEGTDIASPKAQRRMWRRVWISLVVFVLLMPVLLWVAIDQGGKREWRRVQAELRANGEATTFTELNLPTREQVPDEENFCAIPWLVANADGSESATMAGVREALAAFDGRHADRDIQERLFHYVTFGERTNLQAWAEYFEAASVSDGVNGAGSSESSAAERVLTALAVNDEIFRELDGRMAKSQARFLPLLSERVHGTLAPVLIHYGHLGVSQDLVEELRLRMVAVHQNGDREQALRYFLLGMRVAEAAGNEQVLLGLLVGSTDFLIMQYALTECLWAEDWQGDSQILEQCQLSLGRLDFSQLFSQALRTEYAMHFDQLALMRELPDFPTSDLFGSGETGYLRLLPSGWYLNNAAYSGELIDGTLFQTFREAKPMGTMLGAAVELRNKVNALEGLKRINLALVPQLPRFLPRVLQSSIGCELLRRQSILVCALFRYRNDHAGTFPASLSELMPHYLEEVPADPIDGAPLRYLRADSGSGAAEEKMDAPFLLYSIGFDGKDDGGEITIDPKKGNRTKIYVENYLGDWPWPWASDLPTDSQSLEEK